MLFFLKIVWESWQFYALPHMKIKTINMMRYLIILMLGVGGAIFCFGQSNTYFECGTKVTLEIEAFMQTTNEACWRYIEDFLASSPSNRSMEMVPIKIHIIRNSDGTGGLDPNILPDFFSNANNYYNNANIEFEQCSDIHYIDDSAYYDFSTTQENELTSLYNIPDVLDIYFFNTLTNVSGNLLAGLCSFPMASEFPPSNIDAIFFNK